MPYNRRQSEIRSVDARLGAGNKSSRRTGHKGRIQCSRLKPPDVTSQSRAQLQADVAPGLVRRSPPLECVVKSGASTAPRHFLRAKPDSQKREKPQGATKPAERTSSGQSLVFTGAPRHFPPGALRRLDPAVFSGLRFSSVAPSLVELRRSDGELESYLNTVSNPGGPPDFELARGTVQFCECFRMPREVTIFH